jgi:hypothetical protein
MRGTVGQRADNPAQNRPRTVQDDSAGDHPGDESGRS